jgi:hypothetical protein
MPDFIKADAVVKTGLIDGLAEIHDVASPRGHEERRRWEPATFVVGVAA